MVRTLPTALWVVGAGEVAGVGRHVIDAVAAGIPGWDVRVLAPDGPLLEQLPPESVVSADFGPDHGLRASAATLRTVVEDERPELLHSHLAWADFATFVARSDLPLVSTEHGISGWRSTFASNRLDAEATLWAHRLRLRRLDHLICVSTATAGVVRSRWRPPRGLGITVIPNGIDRLPGAMPSEGAAHVPTIGYLGRFAPEKRVDLLLSAFGVLASQRRELRLSLAGSGPLQGDLEAQARQLGVADLVDFAGWVDAEQWLQDIDVICLPSVWENCSYAILQALRAHRGVVAAPVGGNTDLLPSWALAEPTNPIALADTLASQLDDPARRPELRLSVPTVAGMTERIAAVYRQARLRFGARASISRRRSRSTPS